MKKCGEKPSLDPCPSDAYLENSYLASCPPFRSTVSRGVYVNATWRINTSCSKKVYVRKSVSRIKACARSKLQADFICCIASQSEYQW